MAEPAVGGIELQQVRQRPGIGHVVDRHHLHIVTFQGAPRERTAHPAETINSHPYRHHRLPSDIARAPSRTPGGTFNVDD